MFGTKIHSLKIGLYMGLAAIVLGVAVPTVLPAAVVSAQSTTARPPLNLVTSPLPLSVVTKPGQPVTADIRVKNNGQQPEQLKVELLKFGASGDSGRPQLQEREPSDLYFNWVKFSETNFNADPNVWKTVKMTISPPKEAAYGYYYAVLFSRAAPDRPTGGASGVEGGVASLVLVSVDAPGSRRKAEVAELVSAQKVYEFLPAKFTVRLRNTGNVHVSPVGTMFIKRGNTQVATVGFNQERGNILPGTNRVFDLNWGDGFPAYREASQSEGAERELVWDYSKIQNLRFGKYTATLVAVYDDGQRDIPIEAVVSFWVIPWRILGVILLVVLLIGGGIWALLRVAWRGIRRQALSGVPQSGQPSAAGVLPVPQDTQETKSEKPKASTPAPAAAPPEEEPDPSSLAAAFRRKKKKSQPAPVTPQEPEPQQVPMEPSVEQPVQSQPAEAEQTGHYPPRQKKKQKQPPRQNDQHQAAKKRARNRNKKRKHAGRKRENRP